MKMFSIPGVGVIALLCGGVLGYYAGRGRGAPEVSSTHTNAAALQAKVDRLEADNLTLSAQLAETQLMRRTENDSRSAATGAPKRSEYTAVDKLRVLAELQQRNLVKPAVTVLDRNGKLDDTFVALFDLTPAEKTQLQEGIDGVREKLASLEKANAAVTRDDKGNFVIAVQPFPVEGGRVYDEMMQRFADVLGPGRNAVYRQIAAEQIETSLGRFGAAERTYTFGYDPGDRPTQPYTFQDRVVQRSPKGGQSSNSSSTRFRTFDEVAARVGPIISILPPEYKRAK